MKRIPGYAMVFGSAGGAGRPVYVKNELADSFKAALRNARASYQLTTLFRQFAALNADPARGSGLNRANDIREIKNDEVTVEYTLFGGAVIVNYVQIRTAHPPQLKSGLFSVTKSKDTDDIWGTEREQSFFLDKKSAWSSDGVAANFVAIPGIFDSKRDAGRKISKHVIEGYIKARKIAPHDVGNEFSMYWMAKGRHKSDESAQSVASLMQQASNNNTNVNWLVHAQGTDTFKNAAKILKSSPLATAQQKANNPNAGKIETIQNVYFSNPNTSNIKALEKLCQDAGLNYLDANTSHRDLRRFNTFKNAGMEVGKVVSAAVAGGTLLEGTTALKTLGAGGADKVMLGGIEAASSGDYWRMGAALAAAGFIAIGVSKKMKTIRASVNCTFGKGNQKWYSGDDALFD